MIEPQYRLLVTYATLAAFAISLAGLAVVFAVKDQRQPCSDCDAYDWLEYPESKTCRQCGATKGVFQ